jgi:prepilin-type N-terminal cleavage/methylation domain-containing protein
MPITTPSLKRPSPRAFSLVETIATMVILAVVLAVTSRLFLSATLGYTSAATRAELNAELSSAMDRIVQELRSIGVRSGSSPTAAEITSITASSITWVGADAITRQLSLSGTNLLYSESGAPGNVLASSVTSFLISAYDQSNTALAATLSGASTDSVFRLQITLSSTRQGITETFRTRVFPRALLVAGGT